MSSSAENWCPQSAQWQASTVPCSITWYSKQWRIELITKSIKFRKERKKKGKRETQKEILNVKAEYGWSKLKKNKCRSLNFCMRDNRSKVDEHKNVFCVFTNRWKAKQEKFNTTFRCRHDILIFALLCSSDFITFSQKSWELALNEENETTHKIATMHSPYYFFAITTVTLITWLSCNRYCHEFITVTS